MFWMRNFLITSGPHLTADEQLDIITRHNVMWILKTIEPFVFTSGRCGETLSNLLVST